jgi:site-specific DNA recombinase
MLHKLKQLGIEVRCLEETLDHSDPASVLLRAIKLAEPEMDNRRRAKNTQMGLRRARKEGRYPCGKAPLGYAWDRTHSRPRIVPNDQAGLIREAFEMYATGLYAVESVRKAINEKGLPIQKTAFNRLLRNPVYMGKIVVPALGEEEEQQVEGTHETIVSPELFFKVQQVLAKISAKNASRTDKTTYREELPLRGLLECPKCQTAWTGSGSKGNGGVYHYYHCQNGCKERVIAVDANLAFLDYLKGFKARPEIARLYMAIIEDIFKTKEGDREKAIQSQQKKMEELETYLLKIDDMLVTGDLEKDSYRRLKENKQKELQKVQIELTNMRTTDTSFVRYCRYGLSLLTHLDVYYQEASPPVRKKLLGSIFTGKLIFEGGKYRTTGLNEAVALIGLFQKDLENKKTEHLAVSDKTFGHMPATGLEPASYC